MKSNSSTKPRKKRSERKRAVTAADRAFSAYIRARDNHTCVTCGSTQSPTCGHVFSKKNYATRWDEKNAYCQCWPCNFKHEFDPYPYTQYFLDRYGKVEWEELHMKWSSVTKFTSCQIRLIAQGFKEKAQCLER